MAQQWSESTVTDLREVPPAGLEPPRPPCLDLSLLGAADRQQVVVEWNDTGSSYPREATIPDLFALQARRSPGSVAVIAGAVRLTYGELQETSGRLARRLARTGVGAEVPVALLAERSADLIVAILAVLRAGGAYVPIDPAWPDERLRTLLAGLGAPLLLVQDKLRARGSSLSSAARRTLVLEEELAAALAEPAGPEPAGPLAAEGLADGLAYVMYTSGSTGVPKGVGVPHRAVVRLVQGSDYIRFGPEEVFLQLAPAAFDASTLEIWGPLLHGGRLVIAPPGAPSYDALAELIAAHGITTLWLTAGLFHQTVEQMIEPGNEAHLTGFAGVRQLLAGGDVLAPDLVRQALCRLPATRLVNGYGPTENTTFTCCHGMSDPAAVGEPIAIGRPIANTYVLVLDQAGAPVPVGVAGELHAGGDGLARGYQGRPDLTAERFVPCPLGRGARLYRTGDRVCWRPDGRIEFLGRFDHQVKIRGFRIELGEIEAALRSHPRVQEAVVLAPQKAGGERRLIAYVAADPAAVPAAELRDFLRRSLPEYMVPAAFAILPALPLNANGKIDRRALSALEPGPPASAIATARTPVEELVCAIWADVLDRGAVGVHDDFFDLGGHSLLVGRVTTRVAKALDLGVPASLLFEHPTPAGFAAALAASQRGGTRTLPALEPVPREGPLPASYAQERLWLYDQLDPASNAFNIGNALHLRGRLSVAALAASLAEICRRHEVLRTRLVAQGRPFQAIDPPPDRPLALVDLSGLPEPLRAPAARRAVDELQSTPFDLARGPLLRAALFGLADDERVFCLAIHHIAFDGWSLGLLIGEVMALYGALAAGLPSPLPELPIQYADFAAWQRRWLEGELLAEQLAYWRGALGGDHALAVVPADRPASRAGGALEEIRRTFSGELLTALLQLGREQGATLFMILLAALTLLLDRYTGQRRIVVGSMHANRTLAAVEDLIGFFVNVLPLQTTLAPDWTFRQLLERVRATALGAYAHAETPYERILEEVRPGRTEGRNTLFQVMLVLQSMELPRLRLPAVEVRPFEPGRSTKRAPLDLTLTFVPEDGRLLAWIEYDSGLFERATAERFLAHFERVLEDVARDPEQRISELPRAASEPDRLLPDGRLWLTDPAPDEVLDSTGQLGAEEKSSLIQHQVTARKSKLSDKQMALLRQRLKK